MKDFKYHAHITKKFPDWGEQFRWVSNTFGKPGERWRAAHDLYYFRNEEDLTFFLIRWPIEHD